VQYSVIVDSDVEAAMADGTVLRSTVYRPAAEGQRFPVLLTRTPYGRDLAVNSVYFNPLTVAAAGYVVVMQDCRGRFGSDGDFIPSVHEAADGAATVEWAARLPWANGDVGMWGRSYFAETQWRAAQGAPEALKALALGVSAGGNANNGALYRGGAHEFGSRLSWGHASASLNELLREFRDDPELREKELQSWLALDGSFADGSIYSMLPISGLAPLLGTFMRTHILPSAAEGPGSAFSQLWDAASDRPVSLRTLHIGGWFDIFAPNTLDQYRRQLDHSRGRPEAAPRLIMGPWTHTNLSATYAGVSYGMAASAGLLDGIGDLSRVHTAWFDAVLKGDATGLETIPPVLVYFLGENRWRGFKELPEPRTQRSWYFGTEGALQDEAGTDGTAEYTYDPLDPVVTSGGATMLQGPFPAGPSRQEAVEARDDVLVFTSAPFEESVTIFGAVQATLFASSSAVDTDWVVRLCRVDSDGVSTGIADGIVRASWRDAHAGTGRFTPGIEQSPIQPGRVYEYTVSLWETALTFGPGERLRVQVTSSCHPRWDRNLNTGLLASDSAEPVTARQGIRFGAAFPSRLTVGIL
jgi:putative CocE/NonD family hydrolase